MVNEILIRKMEFKDIWFKFFLNQAIFSDESKIEEIPISIKLIKMVPFKVENQIITFRYSGHSFSSVFKNNTNIGIVEMLIKQKNFASY
jgi:hypothetical protein